MNQTPPAHGAHRPPSKARESSVAAAGLAALGVVFGDLGTSPLYTLQTVVEVTGGRFTTESGLGILSLIVWTLLVTISLKYCVFVMRADNGGEGGILALMSLVGANGFTPGRTMLTGMGLIGAALIYGDGVITPAISVLSALEGVKVVTDDLTPFVMPMAVCILAVLFLGQRIGTEKIGRAFGPVMLLWFGVIGVLGLIAILRHPAVLAAIDPRYAVRFLWHLGAGALAVLGGVFLCITGGEALYADMGHFGKVPIRQAWYVIVLPALLLSYAGQIGFLIEKGTVGGNPFFQIAPHWMIYPLVLLATLATIIASQAIITGAYSMTRQAMQLGWLPGVAIRQTSDRIYGQIYVPIVTWLMMAATIGITVGFRTSDRLAGAYGTAVATTMLLTTGLLFVAMRQVWHWPLRAALAVGGCFFVVDLLFFAANLLKIADGGWLPLSLAAILFLFMVTWRTGVEALRRARARLPRPAGAFLADLAAGRIPRAEGTMVFLTRSSSKVPPLVMEHVKFGGALPRVSIALAVHFESVPRVAAPNCSHVEAIGPGLWRVEARFGFFEIPDLRRALVQIKGLDATIDVNHAIFVGARDLVHHKPGSRVLRRGRLALFAFMYRNAVKFIDRFNLPPRNVIEISRQIEI
jgi:KUP system potassium uptake protein